MGTVEWCALSRRSSMKESLHFAGLRQHISAQCNSAGQLGFHVALDGVVGQDRRADAAEVVGVDVQPMEVAVEHDRWRVVGLLVGPLEHGREGGGVAVQAADDIEGVGLQLGGLGERLRLVPVGQRAGPAARIHAFLHSGLRIQ
jgi:hypothetical protein